jgi:glyoxylate reductase
MNPRLPHVVADTPLNATIENLLRDQVEILPWTVAEAGTNELVEGIYTYGHVLVDSQMLDRLPDLKVISNYGVGVDHIDLTAAAARDISVGNTPGVLEGANG